MKIEKNFYDIMMQECDKIEAELKYEQSLLTDAELKQQEEQRAIEAQHIIDLVNEKMQRTWHILDKEKSALFHSLYEVALDFAEENGMNIIVESDATFGHIKLFTPFLHHGVLTPHTNKKTLLTLIKHADSFMLQPLDGMLRFDLDYQLSTPTER